MPIHGGRRPQAASVVPTYCERYSHRCSAPWRLTDPQHRPLRPLDAHSHECVSTPIYSLDPKSRQVSDCVNGKDKYLFERRVGEANPKVGVLAGVKYRRVWSGFKANGHRNFANLGVLAGAKQ